jgi:hypothetical protein
VNAKANARRRRGERAAVVARRTRGVANARRDRCIFSSALAE